MGPGNDRKSAPRAKPQRLSGELKMYSYQNLNGYTQLYRAWANNSQAAQTTPTLQIHVNNDTTLGNNWLHQTRQPFNYNTRSINTMGGFNTASDAAYAQQSQANWGILSLLGALIPLLQASSTADSQNSQTDKASYPWTNAASGWQPNPWTSPWFNPSNWWGLLGNTLNTATQTPPKTGVEALKSQSNMTTATQLFEDNGVMKELANEEPVSKRTVLMPTDAAFDKLDPTLKAKLLAPANQGTLTSLLRYHVAVGDVLSSNGEIVDSITKSTDAIRFFGNAYSGYLVNQNQIANTGSAIQADNGTIVIPIDTLLLPPGFDIGQLK